MSKFENRSESFIQMKKQLTFGLPSVYPSYDRTVNWQFPFSMVDSSLIGAPDEMSETTPHIVTVTATLELVHTWGFYRLDGLDEQAEIDQQ